MKLLEEFQAFRGILYICPCCGEIGRVSDLKLKARGAGIKTWLDDYGKKCSAMDKKEEKFEEVRAELRKKAVEKGRKEAQKIINKAISPTLKALKFDIYDLKPILDPIDFVVFNGMNAGDTLKDITFLSQECDNKELNTIRQQIKVAVKEEKYDWQVARVGDDGGMSLE